MTRARWRRIGWAASGLWALAIFVVSAVPGSDLPGGFSIPGHFIEYAVLGGLLYFSLRFDLDRGRALALAVVIASAYGITDEFHQSFVPLRTPDPRDWLLDTLGALAGAAIVALALAVHERRAIRREATERG